MTSAMGPTKEQKKKKTKQFSLLGNKWSELKTPVGLKQKKQFNFKGTLKTHFSSVSGHKM